MGGYDIDYLTGPYFFDGLERSVLFGNVGDMA